MPLSQRMVESLGLSPGQRVLELAAGPGDTGFLAAQKIAPGTLVTSDGSEAMLEVARARARELAIDNVEFKTLELEWIDLPTASVDAVICRWGIMLCVDPATAASEIRRVLKPGGRLSVAVWDSAELNPWATLDWQAVIELGHMEPPDEGGPGMFALAPAPRLRELLETRAFSTCSSMASSWTGPMQTSRSTLPRASSSQGRFPRCGQSSTRSNARG